MSNEIVRRCRNCGDGHIHAVAKRGRREKYKTLELKVPADIKIPTCDKCGTEWLDAATSKTLTAALEKEYRAVLHSLAAAAIKKIREKHSTRRLEQLLGMSEGYLSKLSTGRSEPSAELVAHLGLLAADVRRRTRELENMWERASKRAA
jgi:hypothetical protein